MHRFSHKGLFLLNAVLYWQDVGEGNVQPILTYMLNFQRDLFCYPILFHLESFLKFCKLSITRFKSPAVAPCLCKYSLNNDGNCSEEIKAHMKKVNADFIKMRNTNCATENSISILRI